ncbi:MAG: DUF2924 domain-containing protein [Planctomycetota bacterium]|nr:DUF2924 domain-containing protein [Planctomycetota bacterium]
MIQNLNIDLAELRRMTPAQLRAKYLDVFGEPSRSANKDFLFKRVAWRMQSLAEGTLSERARQRAAELARDADIRTTIPKMPAADPAAHRRLYPAPPLPEERLPTPATAPTSETRGRTPRLARLMALALRFEGLLARGEVRD